LLRCSRSGYAPADDGLTPDQSRMRECNTRAKEKQLHGRVRSHFMTNCLNGGKGDGRPLTERQEKNEACTKDADTRGLEGAERRGFMSYCVKADRVKEETPQRIKVRTCNRRGKDRRLEGEELRKFVAGCLDGAAATGS
jgi:hypothetical protein